MLKIVRLVLLSIYIAFFSANIYAVTQITLWHAMGGKLGEELNHIATQFNQSQTSYQVVPTFKGDYSETLTATIASFRAKKQPHIVQVFEIGTATMINPGGLIIPVYQLMKDAKINFNQNDFLPLIRKYYSDNNGNLLAMPFNSSSAVMFYNKNAFEKAGLNPNQPPRTWEEVAAISEKLLQKGSACGITTGWPAWTQVETFSAWHNLPFATNTNGFSGLDTKLLFNNATVVHHIATLADWQKKRIFRYGGRGDQAMVLFTSGQCAMMIESSGSIPDLARYAAFPIGISYLPYWANVKDAPQNTSLGGAALWALSGHSAEENQGVAQFFAFLAQPKIQAQWEQASGYLPVTTSSYEFNKKHGYYTKNPMAEIAIKELLNKPPTENSQGFRLGNYSAIRTIIEQKLEAVWSGQLNAQQALDEAVASGNNLLLQFKTAVTAGTSTKQ